MSAYHPRHSATVIPFDGVDVIVGGSITVRKIPLLETQPRIKPETESQKALTSLLQKRKLYYESRRKGPGSSSHSISFTSDQSKQIQSENTSATAADNELSYEEETPLVERTTIAANSKHLGPKKKQKKSIIKSTNDVSESTRNSSDFINFDPKELAERIVNKARQRMRGNHERLLTEAYLKPVRTSTPIPASVPMRRTNCHPKVSPIKTPRNVHLTVTKSFPKTKFNSYNKNNSVSRESSSTLSSPDTSTSDSLEQQQESAKKVVHPLTNYLKITLKLRAAEQQAKLGQEAQERSLRLKKEQDRKAQRIAAIKLKAQQRAEIYALNEVMAKLEKEQFEAATAVKI